MSDAGAKVLVVEDEDKIAAVIVDYLHAAGWLAERAADGHDALRRFNDWRPDVVLLDLNLPGLDGLEVCRALRRPDSVAPQVGVIMVTARVDEVERLLGLEIGADDYLCKPFSPRELVARVRALLRRSVSRGPGVVRAPAAGLVVDDSTQRALWQGQALPLTPVEWRLLRCLVRSAERVLSRARLLEALHDDFRDVSDRAVDSHIKNLRKKLAVAIPGHDCIASVYGVGYRFEAPPL